MIRSALPAAALLAAMLFAPACDSSSGGGGDHDTDRGADVRSADAGVRVDDVRYDEDTLGLPTPPAAPVTLDNGTFAWSQGDRRLTFAVHDGTVLMLETWFDCVGVEGCKIQNDVAKLTCNEAFEKGYSATVADNIFVIGGVKKTDTLTGVLWDNATVKFEYVVDPGFCCSATFYGEAKWAASEDCSGFEVKDCDPYTDAECPAGQNCIFGVGDAPVCMPAGDKEIGDECSNQNQCSDGVCMSIQSVEGQRCFKYCKTDGDCGGGIECMGIEGKDWSICGLDASEYETCNLLSQNCTDPTHGCYWAASSINQPICLPAGGGEAKESCDTSSDCMKGLDCLNNGKCYRICNTAGGEPSCDSPFTSCVENYYPQDAGWCDE